MKLLAVDHITINLLKPAESFRFYGEVLGLTHLRDVDLGDHVLHMYQLPGTQLELIEYKEAQKAVQAGNTDVGVYRHFAIATDDLEEARRRCEGAGWGINMQPSFIPQLGARVMLIRDPNGVEIEMVEKSGPSAAS